MVDSSAVKHPLIPPNTRYAFVQDPPQSDATVGSPASGPVPNGPVLTLQSLQFLQQMFTSINGLVPTLACDAAGTNTITLTPVAVSPQITDYVSFLGMAFMAANNSTGTVTALLNLPNGPLATLPVYKDRGATPAGSGDIVANSFYLFFYSDALNSGNGGFVIR